MSFQRDREAELAWRRWAKAHDDELVAIGIPREVWADRETWNRFLEHGYHPPFDNAREVRFRLEDLSSEQQQRFYRFLDATLPEQRFGVSVWTLLHVQFGIQTNDNRE